MKLNINAKELLALYNMLYDRFDGPNGRDLFEYKDNDPSINDAVQLHQVYNRLKAIIVAGLINPNKSLDPVDSWLKHESIKIDDLRHQNDELRTVAINPNKDEISSLTDDVLTDNEDEVSSDLKCPKSCRRPPNPNMFRHGKYRGIQK